VRLLDEVALRRNEAIFFVRLRKGGLPRRWTGLQILPTAAREGVNKALRNLILRSARAYPSQARRMIDRAIGLQRRGKLFELMIAFAPILAQVCPDNLAQLVLAEVMKPLSKEELEKERDTERRSRSISTFLGAGGGDVIPPHLREECARRRAGCEWRMD
jgi:hypothetical protein